MPLLSGIQLNKQAKKPQQFIPCFDISGGNVDMLHAICEKLAQRGSSAFLSSTPSSIKDYFGFSHFIKTVGEIADKYNVNVAPHLDHATTVEDIDRSLSVGFTSVMFDGSKYDFKKNIKLTRDIVNKAHEYGASVEGELGIIGGKEDEIVSDLSLFPTLEESLTFISETNVDFFAPAIGTLHGFYDSKPNIQWSLVKQLSKACPIPMVLHGGSGLDLSNIKKLVILGFQKVNYATGIRGAFRFGIQKGLKNKNHLKPQVYLKKGRDAVASFTDTVLDIAMGEELG